MEVQLLPVCMLLSPLPAVKMDKKVQREKEEQKEVERIVGCRLLSRVASLVLQFCSSFHFLASLHTRNRETKLQNSFV